jgi:hypothetical protein
MSRRRFGGVAQLVLRLCLFWFGVVLFVAVVVSRLPDRVPCKTVEWTAQQDAVCITRDVGGE